MNDPLNPQQRLPAFEDTPEYRNLCSDRGIAPIRRPAHGGQAYVARDADDDDDDAMLREALSYLEPHRPQPAIGVPPGGLLPGTGRLDCVGHDHDDRDDFTVDD